MSKRLIVILGPTAIGKTELSIQVAERLHTDIISCDSRQFYKDIPIVTAAPSADELSRAKHHFIGMLGLEDYYSCGRFEIEALAKLDELFKTHDDVVMVGGSMLYIDALCNGIDDRPNVDEKLRDELWKRYETEGVDNLLGELKILDPEYYNEVDPHNYKRIIHAVEICLETGKTYTEIRKQEKKQRPFDIVKIGLTLPREEMYDRINRRTLIMMEDGAEAEARSVYEYRHLNSLNTVGFKELFAYIGGEYSLERAIEEIQKNTRRYAKKQMTWWKRDQEINWFSPFDKDKIFEFLGV